MTKLGNTIRTIRKSKHLTLEEVAGLTGLPLSTIRAVEVGNIRVPSPRVLRPIASALEPETNYNALALLVYDDSPILA